MTENEARKIVYQSFVEGWNPVSPEVPFAFDNEAFDARNLSEWVRVSMRASLGGQETLGPKGSRVYRRRGAVLIEVYSPVDRGLLRLDELTRAARDIYEGNNLDQVIFTDAVVTGLPPSGQWARSTVLVSYYYDETK